MYQYKQQRAKYFVFIWPIIEHVVAKHVIYYAEDYETLAIDRDRTDHFRHVIRFRADRSMQIR